MAVRKWVERNYVKVPQDYVILYPWSSDNRGVGLAYTGLFRSNFMAVLYRKLKVKNASQVYSLWFCVMLIA